MKIIQIAAYYPPHIGGLEYCAKNISLELAKNGHHVTVLTSNVGAGKPRTVTNGGLTERYLRGLEFAHTPIIPALPFVLMRVDPTSVIHIHLSHVYTELIVLLVAKFRHLPYVAHFHMDVDVSGRLGFLFKLYKRTLLPYVIRGAAKVITLSDEQRALVVNRYHVAETNVCVIPNGVSQEFFVNRTPYEATNRTNLLFVGRFALQKNLPRLLHALPLMKHPVHLSLVGDGEKRPQIEQIIAELKLESQVTLHGRKGGVELAALYQQADVFVMSSDREGMPLVLLEAMAAGLPVVASDVQGLREFVSHNGVLVKNPSPETFAAALDDLIAHPATLRRLSAQSRTWAEHYSWTRLVELMEQLYREARS
jgi:glycosyltransferase involved in cell wall biosynthesis